MRLTFTLGWTAFLWAQFAIGSPQNDYSVYGYDAAPRENATKAVRGVAFSADGKWLLTGGVDDKLRVWDLSKSQVAGRLDKERLSCLALSPTGHEIAGCMPGDEVSLYQIDAAGTPKRSGTLRAAAGGHTYGITALAWSKDGGRLYSANGPNNGAIKQWLVHDRKEIKLKGGGSARYWDIAPAPDERAVMASGADWTFRIIGSMPDNEARFQKKWSGSAGVFLNGTFETGYTVLIGNWDGQLEVDRLVPALPPAKGTVEIIQRPGEKHLGEVRRVVLSPDGNLWASSDRLGEVRLWNRSYQTLGRGKHRYDVQALAFSRDGKLLASGDEKGTVRVWQTQPFRLLASLVCFADGAVLAYQPDGTLLGDPRQVGVWYRNGQGPVSPPDRQAAFAIVQPPRGETPRKEERAVVAKTNTNEQITISKEPLKKEEPKKEEPPKKTPVMSSPQKTDTTPPPVTDPALVAARAAAREACNSGNLPAGLTPSSLQKWRSDSELATIATDCINKGSADLARMASRLDPRFERECAAGGEFPVATRAALKNVEARFLVALSLNIDTAKAAAGLRQTDYYQGMADLCFLGRPQEAAQTLDAIGPPFRDSQDRARQAYAKLALARAVTAVNTSNLDEADKQLKEFRKQKAAIRSENVGAEEATDEARVTEVQRRLEGKRLFKAGVNAINDGKLEDGRASLTAAQPLLGPAEPESAEIARLLQKLQPATGTTPPEESRKAIEAALAAADKAFLDGDLDTARAKALAAIALAESGSPLTEKARTILADVETAERRQARMRWGAAGVVLFFLLAPLTIPTWRAVLYSSFGLQPYAARIYFKQLAANSTNRRALTGLYGLRSLPMVSGRLADLFQTFLAKSPDDGRIALTAGLWALERGNDAQAQVLLNRALELGVSDPALFRALLRLPSSVDQPAADQLRKIAAAPEQHEATEVLARHYMADRNAAPEALASYESTLLTKPDDDFFRLETIRAYLRSGRTADAARHLGLLLDRSLADQSVLDALLDLARAGDTAAAIRLLASSNIGDFDRLRTGEALAERDAGCRPDVDALYGSMPANSNETVAAIMRAHHLAGSGDTAGAAALAESRHFPGAEQDPELLTQFCLLLRRLIAPRTPALRVALARTEIARGNYAAAFEELEVLRREKHPGTEPGDEAMRALSRMNMHEMSAAFFTQAGWRIQKDGQAVLPPAGADPQVCRRFASARIYVAEAEIEAQDVLTLREESHTRGVFLIAPERPRRDVYALLYATLVEYRDLSLVPLDKAAMKSALAAGASADLLLETLNLWLGRGDVFDERNPISDSAAFFGRTPLIHQLLNKVLNRQNFGLYGLRKMGKTSLIFQLREGLPADMLLLYIDLQGIASASCTELCCRIVEELRRQAEARTPGSGSLFRTPSYDRGLPVPEVLGSMEADLSSALALIGNGKDARILLVLDEIEWMIPHGEHKGFAGLQEFFRLIRGMYQQRRQIVSAVVGADPTLCRLGKWGGVDNPVFQFYDEIFLAPLDRVECDAMVQGLAAILGVDFLPESLDLLYAETAGHPFVTRQLCSRILNRFPERPLSVTAEMVAVGVSEYLELRFEYLREVFQHYLSHDAQALLEGIASRRSATLDRTTLDQVIAESVEAPDARMRALQELELFHLLVRRNGAFEMPMGILMRYLRSDWKTPESVTRSEHA